MSGTSKPIQQELEKFFIATDEPEDNKLEIVGWKGPKIAMKAIKDSAKSFSKDGECLCRHQRRNSQAVRRLPSRRHCHTALGLGSDTWPDNRADEEDQPQRGYVSRLRSCTWDMLSG